MLGEVENRAGVGDDAIAAGVRIGAGVENEVVPAGLLDLLVEGVGDVVDVVAVGVTAPDVDPAGAVGGEGTDELGLGDVLDGHCMLPFIGCFLSTPIGYQVQRNCIYGIRDPRNTHKRQPLIKHALEERVPHCRQPVPLLDPLYLPDIESYAPCDIRGGERGGKQAD